MNMKIPQIDCRVGAGLQPGVERANGGYRLNLQGHWFDSISIERSIKSDGFGNTTVIEHVAVLSYGIIHAFDSQSDMLALLARWMHGQKDWFGQAFETNRSSGHDYGFAHVCIPVTDERDVEAVLGWALYHSYQFDLFDLLHAIKQYEEQQNVFLERAKE
jgi:hypothetical protein